MRTSVHCVRTSVLIFLLIFTVTSSKAQSIATGKFEVGIGIGPLFFLGDVGGNLGVGTRLVKDVNLPATNISKGAHINYYPVEWLGVRAAFNYGSIEGADSLIKDQGGSEMARKVRNLHFRTTLAEGYAALEFYPTVFIEQYEGLRGKLRPYGVLGIGMFKFNPQATYYAPNGTSRWVDLQPLRTEGQGMAEYAGRQKYKLMEMEVPMGVGVKYYLRESMYIGLEVLHRKTFTDYMDDISSSYINPDLFDKYLAPDQAVIAKQVYFRGFGTTSRPDDGSMRGQKKNNDSFFSSIFRFGWRLNDESTPQSMRCPKF